MRKTIFYMVIISILAFSVVAHAGWFGPSNFNECVLKNMKGVKSDRAATIIAKACRRQFPAKVEKKPDTPSLPAYRSLSQEELKKLTVQPRLDPYGKSFSVDLYNGNRNITITEVTIKVWIGEAPPLEYANYVFIPPLTIKKFSFSLFAYNNIEAEIKWIIARAKTFKEGIP